MARANPTGLRDVVSRSILTFAAVAADAAAGGLTLVNTNASGVKLGTGALAPCASNDGRFVAMATNATNTGTTIPPALFQVFVKDTLLGTLTLVSKSAAGVPGNGNSYPTDITPDGRYVVFHSDSTNLVAGDTSIVDVFVRDTLTNTIQKVSEPVGGGLANSTSSGGRISDDGSKILFMSQASSLVPGDTNNAQDVFVRDLTAGTLVRGNVGPNGEQDLNFGLTQASMSSDGRFVCFVSSNEWVPEDQNPNSDVYVKDLVTGQLRIASVNPNGISTPSQFISYGLISGDGNTVVFQSWATDLVVPTPGYGGLQIYSRRLDTGAITLVSTPSGTPNPALTGSNGGSTLVPVDVSHDGRFVMFYTSATNLTLADASPGNLEVYLRDTIAGRTSPVAVKPDGMSSAGVTLSARFARNGRSLVFHGNHEDLYPGQPLQAGNVFWMSNYGFSEAGAALAGTNGLPRLVGTGTMLPGSANSLDLGGAAWNAAALLVYSAAYQPLPFKSGTLLTGGGGIFTLPFVTSGAGTLTLPFTMPVGPLLPGAVTLQCVIADGGAPQGVALSNGLFAHIR